MNVTQILFGSLLVAVLIGLAGYYGWRQLRVLRQPADPADEMLTYQRRQARLRLFGAGLMTLLALLLAGALLFLEEAAQELADRGPIEAEAPRHRDFVNFYTIYWIIFLIVLLLFLVVASLDFWHTRNFARRQYQRLQADRRAMIEQQAAKLRAGKNTNGYAMPPGNEDNH